MESLDIVIKEGISRKRETRGQRKKDEENKWVELNGRERVRVCVCNKRCDGGREKRRREKQSYQFLTGGEREREREMRKKERNG